MKWDRSLKTSFHVCMLRVCVWQYKEGKKLKPKPNYNSVDLSEVEWEDTEEKVSDTHMSFLKILFSFFCISSVSCIVRDP